MVETVVDQCRDWDADRLVVRFAEGRGSPARFWIDRGFVPDGHLPDGSARSGPGERSLRTTRA